MTLHRVEPRPLPGASVEPQAAPATSAVSTTTVPLTIVRSPTMTMANPSALYLRNPILGSWMLGRPQPRGSFALPVLVSPDPAPTDATLFEEPADPTKKHYLPKYALATTGSGGASGYSVSFAANSDGFVLTVGLTDVTNPTMVTTDVRIDPATRYLLTANLDGQNASWDFNVASTQDTGLTLSLTVTDPSSRDSIYRAMTDPAAHAQLILRRSLQLAVPSGTQTDPSQTLYRESLTAIDSSIAFTFDPVLDQSIFTQLGAVSAGQSTWVVTQVPYAADNRSFPYYQDSRQPSLVYYLPDTFQISRQQTAPHAPNITIATSGTDPSTLSFTLSFLAIPIWDPKRIADAAKWWQQYLHASTPPTMQLFEASNTSLQLTLPSADGTGSPSLATQSSAIIDIAAGVSGAVSLSLAQLQQVYAALFDQVSQLLSGVVNVTVGSDVESIHFSWRATDFVGSVLDATTTFDAEKSSFTAVVTNTIESPVHIDALPATIVEQNSLPPTGNPLPTVTPLSQTANPPLPLDLAPAPATAAAPNSVTLTVLVPPQNAGNIGQLAAQALGLGSIIPPAPGAPVPVLTIDYSHTAVTPDSSALWDAIVSNQVVGPIRQNITVTAFKSMFGGTGSSPVLAAHVVFESGQTLDFNASSPADANGIMTQAVSLAVPVKAYVLGSGDTSTYRYRIDLVSANGTQQGQWISTNETSFYVQTSS
ncbi:MAG TPA: hypothetical protein VGK84_03645 [Candidatus Tumulicola sp.]